MLIKKEKKEVNFIETILIRIVLIITVDSVMIKVSFHDSQNWISRESILVFVGVNVGFTSVSADLGVTCVGLSDKIKLKKSLKKMIKLEILFFQNVFD